MIIRGQKQRLTGVILAGGKSLRIGGNKQFLKIRGRYLIDWVVDCLAPVVSSTLIVTNEEQYDLLKFHMSKANVIADLYPGKGPLGGIYTGLSQAENPHSIIVGCDMPFINSALASYLIGYMRDYDAVVPVIGDMLEPLHAIYSKNCLPKLELLLQRDKLNISPLFGLVATKYISDREIDIFDPEHLSFTNINTRHDMAKAYLQLAR
ncbi:MAG: molybdenum cofactor guanylyltransferase [Dehalococcoidia bacterium]|nr:molybdenum cofactor guanylyltransferase [Dehalococcoidia bacterium]